MVYLTLNSIMPKRVSKTEEDRGRFLEVAASELRNLHEGNFARYRVRPSEFENWRQKWV
jgi:hypothetical protein